MMKLTVSCQVCGKILTIVEKDSFTDDDVNMYEQSVSCDTVQGTTTDDDGNIITVYDGQSNIQASKLQE